MASYLEYVIPLILLISLNFTATKAQSLSYQYQVCSTNKFTPNSTYQTNLRTLFSSLSSEASNSVEFFNNTVAGTKTNPSDTVYGLFMCRGDIPSDLCSQCVGNGTQRLSTHEDCSTAVAAVVYYDQCIVRYSNRSFFSVVTMSAGYVLPSPINMTNQESFKRLVYDTLNKTADDAADEPTGDKKFATRETNIDEYQKLYCLAQCTPDLSLRDCRSCLESLINSDLPRCCAGTQGARVLYPNCVIRYEIYPFYRSLTSAPAQPPTAKSGENKKGRSRTIILVVVPIVILVTLCTFCYYFLRRRARKTRKSLLRENFGEESSILEGLQFDLATIKVATNNFSHENKIGKGGFGEVYKGLLPDGRHIAVKRLSTSSRQGSVEFKNEILLIAKLQHRNLVEFLGFCLEEEEKILIYEYVPNRSLDYFLFDTQQQKLSWYERYKIIGGTALGILYLHEYSRLKIIHRDLKPSNILLDESMNPKISDFGLARIIDIDQNRAETDRIVGTYGYMSPEYAMLGQFSEKSDVFSFGIIILEIITGKKNASSYEPHYVEEGLMTYVWRHWKNQTPLSILDPNMKENYFQTEVIRCIEIGLLCVQENPNIRPTMADVVSYLNNHSLKLSSLQEPAFYLHGIDKKVVMQEGSSSNISGNSSTPFSVNEMSISKFYPR
uniref:Cysteine-rich receptor-like protein kinase 25 n=1 Tax=Cajanus cajan TaxID=3821 RepID=A0A151U732_CAJCA|nr:Cysteine-rich receptor-like protein kinase 25 [Cajanus cajan]